jgi:hypothetical protein
MNLTLGCKYQKKISCRMTGIEKQRMRIPGIPTGKVAVMETQNSSLVMEKKARGHCTILLCRYFDERRHGELQNTMAQ